MKKVEIHRFLTAFTALLMITVAFSTLILAEKEDVLDNPIDNSHTVLIELKSAQTCGFCPYQEDAITQLSGDYEFIGLACPHYDGIGYNQDITDRISELYESGDGFPTSYYDGGYDKVIGGSSSSQTNMQAALDNCAARTVADIDLALTVNWLGGAEMGIDLDVTNTGSSTYDGHVHIYIVEITSRWNSNDGDPFEHALLSLQSNEDVSVNPSQTWNTNFNWDGDDYGYGDITSDNIRVIASVFDQSTQYTDETIGAMPIINFAPTADFSHIPEFPEAGESISFSDESLDSDGIIMAWDWDFGDGSTSTLENPIYSYMNPGYYTVTLSVEDDDGATDAIEKMIIVTEVGETVLAGQTLFGRGFPIRAAIDGDWAGAQSFLATTTNVTRAEVYLRKFGTPEFDLTVELREGSPTGTILDSVVIPILNVPSSWTWFEIDFTDTTVVNGTEYFIVAPPAPSGVTTSFGYEWGYALGNQYDDGSFWFTRDGGNLWRDLPTMYEFTFIVFGN